MVTCLYRVTGATLLEVWQEDLTRETEPFDVTVLGAQLTVGGGAWKVAMS